MLNHFGVVCSLLSTIFSRWPEILCARACVCARAQVYEKKKEFERENPHLLLSIGFQAVDLCVCLLDSCPESLLDHDEDLYLFFYPVGLRD